MQIYLCHSIHSVFLKPYFVLNVLIITLTTRQQTTKTHLIILFRSVINNIITSFVLVIFHHRSIKTMMSIKSIILQ